MNKILVTYASKYGSTREMAERIGAILCQTGIQADVLPIGDTLDLSAYRSVVVGSAIYVGKWRKEAVRFLRSHEQELAERSVWLFSSGPTGEGHAIDLVEGKLLPAELKPVVNRIQPRDITIFHGHIDPGKINSLEKWAIKSLVKKPFGDFRDWNSIDEWAIFIAAAVKKVEVSMEN